MEKVGKQERVTQEMGRGQWRRPCRRAPRGRGGKARRDKEQEKENKGAVGVNPPHPSLPELWGCRGDCLQGSGLRGEGGARAGGSAEASPSILGEPRSGALLWQEHEGWVGPLPIPPSPRADWGWTGGRGPSSPLLPPASQHREGPDRGAPAPTYSSWRGTVASRCTEPCL